ncbi:MAG: hypothetical protein SVO01_06275 [Thermotogota bacterium]|nr:hypothetical protein [Thermotogota bacterium]
MEASDLTKCKECGSTEDVNCSHFAWRKIEEEKQLCHDCENNLFFHCSECGAFIDRSCMFGAGEYDNDGEFVGFRCPECEKIMDY